MKKVLFKGFAIALLGAASLCYGKTNLLHTKLARATSGQVSCKCAATGGNQNCAANNSGSSCASGDNIQCSDYNNNCSGGD